MFGDWGGLRTRWKQDGIDVGASYLGELASNVSGGKRTGTDYAGQMELSLGLDWGTIAGLNGLSTHIAVVNRHGRNISTDYIGDHLLHVQQIYGGGGDVAVHLVYAYMEQKLGNGGIDIKAGRIPALNEFGNLPTACDFMSLTICVNRGLDANLGWTQFPISNWAGTIRVHLTNQISLGTGVFEVNPRFGGSSGFDWSTDKAKGVMVPLELDWTPKLGSSGLPGIYKLGAYYDSSEFPDWSTAVNGLPVYATTAPPQRHARAGFYVLAQQMLWRKSRGSKQGLSALAGYMYNAPNTSLFEDFAFVGLIDKGPFPGRPHDRAGIQFTYARVSPHLTDLQRAQTRLGLPLANGALGVQSNEMLVEANYSIASGHGLRLMPDLQWVIHPNGSHVHANALVLGFQVKATF